MKTTFGQSAQSQQTLPNLQLSSMRDRFSKASDVYKTNLKLYNRLSNTKSTVPTVSELRKVNQKNDVLRSRLSNYNQVKEVRGMKFSSSALDGGVSTDRITATNQNISSP